MSNNPFASLKPAEDILGGDEDRIGGFQLLDTNVYDFTVKMCYLIVAESGAKGVFFEFEDASGNTMRKTLYVTSGTAKGGQHWWVDRDGNKNYLPSYVTANSIFGFATGKQLFEQETSDREVEVWDSEEKKMMPRKMPVFMEILGKQARLGVVKQMVDGHPDKTVSREENDIDKAFHPVSGVTLAEMSNGETEGQFIDKWLTKNKGQVIDKRKDSRGSNAGGVAGMPSSAGASGAGGQVKSLFAK